MSRSVTPRSSPRSGRSIAHLVWSAVDVVLVLAFAASGRRTHEHGMSLADVLDTAWPFLVAYLIAALAVRSWRSPCALWPTAVGLWLGTVALGLALRALSGDGVALSLQVVTLLVLGAFLLVPRAVVGLLQHRSGRRGSVVGDRRPAKGTP